MFYRKNIYAWEQVLRLIVGAMMIGIAIWALPGSWIGYGLMIGGAGLMVTGFLGYCPACAMVGRKPVSRP